MDNSVVHIVTGAAGRVGFPLCLELIKRGAKVRALDKAENEATARLRALGCEVVYCDITDAESIDGAFCGGAVVYHLAGIITVESRPDKLLEAVNVGGTKNVIEACLKQTAADQLIF